MARGAFPQSQYSSSGVWLLPATSLMEKQSKTKQCEMNKYFLELLPPKESDRINQNVVNSVHKNRTGNLKEHESTCSSSLAAGNTGLVFLRALLTKLGEKMRGPVQEKASHVKFKVQETWDSERTMPYQEWHRPVPDDPPSLPSANALETRRFQHPSDTSGAF